MNTAKQVVSRDEKQLLDFFEQKYFEEVYSISQEYIDECVRRYDEEESYLEKHPEERWERVSRHLEERLDEG